MVVQIDRRHTGGEDINHPNCDNTPIQPVLLVEGSIAHLRPIFRIFGLRTDMKREKGLEVVLTGQNSNNTFLCDAVCMKVYESVKLKMR